MGGLKLTPGLGFIAVRDIVWTVHIFVLTGLYKYKKYLINRQNAVRVQSQKRWQSVSMYV